MQGDLISKSALVEELQKYFINNSIHKNDLAEVIANMPCAYDVEKVVAELERNKKRFVDVLHNPVRLRQYEAFCDAIAIVRNGGKE